MFVACLRQWREMFSDTLKCQSCSDIPLSREVVITTILPFLSQIYLCVWFLCQFTSRCSQDCSAFFRRYRLCSLQRFKRYTEGGANILGMRTTARLSLAYTSFIDRLSFMSLLSPEKVSSIFALHAIVPTLVSLLFTPSPSRGQR